MHPSIDTSIHHVTSPSINLSICHATSPSIDMSICHAAHLYINMSVHPVLSPSDCLSPSGHLCATPTSLSDCPSPPDHLYNNSPSLSDCLSLSNHLYKTSTCPSMCLSSITTECLHDSSQSLAVVNGEQSHNTKEFHGTFTNYDLLLHDLDESSIYTCASRHVAPPESGEDAHVIHEIMGDLGGTTLYEPRLGSSYVLPRLWDHGRISTTSNVPRMFSN